MGARRRSRGLSVPETRKRALRLVRIASGEFEKDNEAHRARRQGQTTPLTDSQLSGLALEWLEDAARRGILSDIQSGPLDQFEAEETIENLREVWGVEAEQLKRGYFYDISRDVDAFLEKRRIILDKQQDTYWMLCRLILRASIEQTRRKISRLEGDPNPRPFDDLFKGVGSGTASATFVPIAASSPPPATKPEGRTLGDVITTYLGRPAATRLSRKSKDKETATFDLLGSIIGRERLMTSITADDCTAAHHIISKLPPNYTKRFGNLAPSLMAERATKEGLAPIKAQTQRSYLTRLKKLFMYAFNAHYIERNPAAIIELPEDDTPAEEKRDPFSIDQLRTVFTSTVYTGCMDDERGALKPGPNVFRRGRFWVPLIALWTGLRLNECCQLATDDVGEEDGVWVIWVRRDPKTGKRIKTRNSRRFVPIHPELKRIGFIAFVEAQRNAGLDRLFPELKPSSDGYLSGPFSKRFAYYLDQIGITDPKVTFHSSRHNFADLLGEADISAERQDRLGGWSSGSSTRRVYGNGRRPSTLYKEMCKIEYPGLDLSHLYLDDC